LGKKILEENQCGSGSDNQKGCFFPCKFADLRFADCHTSEICGFFIAEKAQEFVDLRFVDL
jgi:hypothetical protein